MLACRKRLFGDPNIKSEIDVTKAAAAILKSVNVNATSQTSTALHYSLGTVRGGKVTVCSRFWAAAYGICESKMKKVRDMVKGGTRQIVHGNSYKKYKTKGSYVHSFWTHFMNDCCQRPTNEIRLFPLNKPYRFIYDELFKGWFRKQV